MSKQALPSECLGVLCGDLRHQLVDLDPGRHRVHLPTGVRRLGVVHTPMTANRATD